MTDVALMTCPLVFLQVLLFLQKEKEESSPEAQVKERRELETLCSLSSFKWKQLHKTVPVPFLFPSSSSPVYPCLLIAPGILYLPSTCSLFLVLSAPRILASLRNVAVLLTPQQTLDSFYRRKWNVPALQRGAWEKVKKLYQWKLEYPWREYEKKILFETVVVSRFHKERVLFQQSAVDQGEPFEWKKSAP